MMKYILILMLLIPLSSFASTKNEIKEKLEKTENIYFKFKQKINDKVESGECKLSYPKKIYCLYDDIYKKVLVSNGRSLIINSKKIKNYYIYKLKDTPLDLILDKKYLIKKIESINKIEENNDTFFFEIEHNKNLVTIFFDKKRFDIQGWSTVDIYQNKVETKLFEVETNLMIGDNIYRIKKYIN